MRLSAALLALAVLALSGIAGAATLDKTRLLPAAPTALDMSDQAVATALPWSPDRCESVDLWSPDVGARYGFHAAGPCPQTSTGRGIASVATSYNRVVWLAFAGGNTREWTLWTATRRARTPLKLRFAAADVSAAPPIVLGPGDEWEVPYAVGRDVVSLSDTGVRLLSWHAPARVVSLAGGVGGTVVLLDNGHLEVVSAKDKHVTDYAYAPGDVQAFRIASVGLIVNTKSDIEIRTPSKTTALGIGPGARLVGFSDGNVVYTRGGEIRDYKRPQGDDVLLRRVKQPFLAKFDRRGLAWTSGRHVCFAVRMYVEHPNVRAPGC